MPPRPSSLGLVPRRSRASGHRRRAAGTSPCQPLLRLEVPLGPSDPTTNGAALYRQVEDEMHQLAGLQARELFETLGAKPWLDRVARAEARLVALTGGG